MNKVKISYKISEKDGVKCSVEVNGYEIADKINKLTMRLSADRLPVVVFEIPATDIEVETDAITKGLKTEEEGEEEDESNGQE